jgi:hypothetical protein
MAGRQWYCYDRKAGRMDLIHQWEAVGAAARAHLPVPWGPLVRDGRFADQRGGQIYVREDMLNDDTERALASAARMRK